MFRTLMITVLSLVVIGEAGAPWELATASPPRLHLIEIQAFRFMPQQTIVAPGDRIRWVNRDIVPHTVTAEGGVWLPRILSEGESWEFAVEAGGFYAYFCEFHPHMKGWVEAH